MQTSSIRYCIDCDREAVDVLRGEPLCREHLMEPKDLREEWVENKKPYLPRSIHVTDYKYDERDEMEKKRQTALEAEKQRDYMRAWNLKAMGYTYKEIGESIGVCRQTAYMRVRRAKRNLCEPDYKPSDELFTLEENERWNRNMSKLMIELRQK